VSFNILVHGDVLEELSQLDSSTKKRILAAMRQLRENPSISKPGSDIRKLRVPEGSTPLYRLRVGEYRVIFAVEGTTVLVTELVHRSQAYRNL
jgi:mRNA interferase RelE/StbE